MKRLLTVFLVMVLVFTAVIAAQGASAEEITPEEYASLTPEGLLDRLGIAERENLTAEEFARLIDTFRLVEINYDRLCLTDTWSITEQARDLIKLAPDERGKYMALLMASETPQVRAVAYEQVSGVLGADEDDLDAAVSALEKEEDPYCLYVAIKGVGNQMKNRQEIADFVFRMADHENPLILKRAANYIGSPLTVDIPGTTEKIIAMMGDENQDVRKAACDVAGDHHDESVIEPLAAILSNPDEEKIHSAAVEGLSTLWLDYPFHEHASEAAYRAVMDYYSRTPRTDKVPSWAGIAAFNMVNAKAFSQWPEIADWFDADEFFEVMADVIADPEMNWLGKEPAMKAILALCPEKWPELEPVMSTVDNEKVLELYEKLKEKAENP